MDEVVIVYASPVNPEDRARLIDVRKICGGRPTNKVNLARLCPWSRPPRPRSCADGASATRTPDIEVVAASAADAAVDEGKSAIDEAAVMVTSKADEAVDEAVIVYASPQTCQRPENPQREGPQTK